MKTDDLIAAISADAKSAKPPIASMVWLAAGAGVIGAAVVFLSVMQIRPDIGAAVFDPSFLYKWVLTLTLLASAMVLVMQLARPQPISGNRLLLLLAPAAVLLLGVAYELMTLPQPEWMPTMIGNSAVICMIFIPLLSALPLAAFLIALRQGAPSRPALTGAVAGLASTGIGATLYASHCTNDSTLFIAAWYVIGTAIVAGAGAALGARLLRW
jgi:hypothetical protein